MTSYRPPIRAQKQEDMILHVRKQITAELRAAHPNLSAAEIEEQVVRRLQNGPPPRPPGIPKKVREARREERRATVKRGKSARL